MASPCAIERDQLLQLRSGYEATKTIGLSVHWVCVQKTSGKMVDFVCCQDLCAKIECSVQLLVVVKVLGRSLGKFSPEKIFSSPACWRNLAFRRPRVTRRRLSLGRWGFVSEYPLHGDLESSDNSARTVCCRQNLSLVLWEAGGFLVTSFGRDCRSQAEHRRVVPEHTSFVQVRSCGFCLHPNKGVRPSVLCNVGYDP